MGKNFSKLVVLNLVLIYLVIIAGSVVRTSGSGMGCPDWPKCFDCWVPPTHIDQLPENYKEIYADKRKLKVEKFVKLLTSIGMESEANQLLSDPDILKEEDFNPRKTWTEYINRLSGFLAGNGVLIMFLISIVKFRKRKDIFWLSLTSLIVLVYTAWLGSVVVSTNLIPWIITAHMVPSYLLIALILIIYYKSIDSPKPYFGTQFKLITLVFIALTLVQVYLGTRVRQEIDTLSSSDIVRAAWVDNLDLNFYLHRSFSWVILALLALFWYQFKKNRFPSKQMVVLTVLILIEIFTGVIMAYLDVPAFSQPMHLLMSTLIFGLLVSMFIKTQKKITE